MNIKLLKFTTGEEVIINLISEDPLKVTFKDGLTMVFDGQRLQAIPFSMMIEENQEVSISRDKLIFITDPRKDLIEQYKSQFSPILTPNKSIIT